MLHWDSTQQQCQQNMVLINYENELSQSGVIHKEKNGHGNTEVYSAVEQYLDTCTPEQAPTSQSFR